MKYAGRHQHGVDVQCTDVVIRRLGLRLAAQQHPRRVRELAPTNPPRESEPVGQPVPMLRVPLHYAEPVRWWRGEGLE